MPEFHFTFGSVSKDKPKKKTTKSVKHNKPKANRSKIINKDVEGVVIKSTSSLQGGIRPFFDVVVMIGNREIIVPIENSGYDCHNVKIVYRYINDNYIKHIRNSEDISKGLTNNYVPVRPSSKVKGNVIEISNKLFFKIKKIMK